MSSWIHWSSQSHLPYFAERIKNLYIWIQVICEHELPDLPNWKTIHIICTCAQLDCSACWIQFRITRFDWQEQPWSSFLMIMELPSCLPFQEEFQQRGIFLTLINYLVLVFQIPAGGFLYIYFLPVGNRLLGLWENTVLVRYKALHYTKIPLTKTILTLRFVGHSCFYRRPYSKTQQFCESY